MRAYWTEGIHIILSSKDKGKKHLVCRLPDWKKPKLLLHIVDEVKKRGTFEEQGFHIEAYPKTSPELIERYDVFLSKERFNALMNNTDDYCMGSFISRSMYDRISFLYCH